jgi:ketosteroid isomerase-like protein
MTTHQRQGATAVDPIQELIELEAIKKVKRLYAHHLDGKDVDRLVDLFTEDAVCEFGSSYGEWRGHDEIRSGYEVEVEKVDGVDFPFMHAITTPWIELAGDDSATGRWLLLEMGTESMDVKAPLRLTGVYTDVYRKVGGSWKIARTHLDFTWPMRDISAPGTS